MPQAPLAVGILLGKSALLYRLTDSSAFVRLGSHPCNLNLRTVPLPIGARDMVSKYGRLPQRIWALYSIIDFCNVTPLSFPLLPFSRAWTEAPVRPGRSISPY